jgi:pre-mRNA-processing factor 6
VANVIHKAVKSLAAHGVQVDRDQWIKDAETCERNNQLATCRAIIKETIGQDIDEEDKKKTWCDVWQFINMFFSFFFFSLMCCYSDFFCDLTNKHSHLPSILSHRQDAENALARGSINVGRAIYAHATDVYPSKKSLWLRFANLEKRYGTHESLEYDSLMRLFVFVFLP